MVLRPSWSRYLPFLRTNLRSYDEDSNCENDLQKVCTKALRSKLRLIRFRCNYSFSCQVLEVNDTKTKAKEKAESNFLSMFLMISFLICFIKVILDLSRCKYGKSTITNHTNLNISAIHLSLKSLS
jgi:hypothetical protein